MRPDFIFFRQQAEGVIIADIVDPHGHHLADSMPKIRGLASYATSHGAHFGRIEAVALLDGAYRFIDLQDPDVRTAVLQFESAERAYKDLGQDYPLKL